MWLHLNVLITFFHFNLQENYICLNTCFNLFEIFKLTTMDPIIIEPTTYMPLVEFDPNGRLLIEGRSIPEDVTKLFNPLILFAAEMVEKEVNFDINLDYFNTATSKKLLELLKNLDANNSIEKLNVFWHYETDDEDSVEMAEIFEESLIKAKFTYREHDKSISLAKIVVSK